MSFNKAWEEPGKTSARPWPLRPLRPLISDSDCDLNLRHQKTSGK